MENDSHQTPVLPQQPLLPRRSKPCRLPLTLLPRHLRRARLLLVVFIDVSASRTPPVATRPLLGRCRLRLRAWWPRRASSEQTIPAHAKIFCNS